jgi:hypothetical protein
LCGRGIQLCVRNDRSQSKQSLAQVASSLAAVTAWPHHPWETHRIVSMFELLPTLYLQSRGDFVPKWCSFEQARRDFGSDWWSYDVLREIRAAWPRQPVRRLDQACFLSRNPWTALAVWRRIPTPLPRQVEPLLSVRLLDGLQALTTMILDRAI